MDLEIGSRESVERRTVGNNGCANPADPLRRDKKGRVYCIRHFPVGCGPPRRPCTENSGTLVQPCLISSNLKHLEDEEEQEPVLPSCENDEAELELAAGLEKLELMKTSPSLHEDSSKLSKTGFPVLPRVYPPRRKVSGVRSFPPGCGRRYKAQTNLVAPAFGTSKTATWAKNKQEYKEPKRNTANATKSRLNSERLETGKGNQSNKDAGKNPGMKPSTDNVTPEQQTIVMGLMSLQNCPWTQKRSVSRPTKRAKGIAEAKARKWFY